ncbi:MAG: chaperone modulator CbpM [Luteolibacter sp.]
MSQETHYTLEIVSSLTGISSETILHYQQHGLVHSQPDAFDDEDLHTLRRLEHIRQTCGTNLSGLKLIHDLLLEVEQLRSLLRSRR